MRIHDSRVTAPFIGPNAWVALVQPVSGGNIPPQHAVVEAKMTFKDGGAYDFHTRFVQIKESLRQAADAAAETSGSLHGSSLGGLNMNAVHLEQLPVYEAHSNDQSTQEAMPGIIGSHNSVIPTTRQQPAPAEPPPGYDEVQREAVAERLGEQRT